MSKASKQTKQKSEVAAWVAIAISIVSVLFSGLVYVSNQKTNPLAYRIVPTIVSYTNVGNNNVIVADLRIVVSDGAIGDIRFFNYLDGIVEVDKQYSDGKVTEFSSKLNPKFTFVLETPSKNTYLVQYVLAKGKDGSSVFGMVTYTITESIVSAKYWTSLDVALVEISESYNMYQEAISNYRILADFLKERGEL